MYMNKTLNKIFGFYVFAYAFFFASRQISDADFWFHLKTGEYIVHTGMIPRTELWSFTFHGTPWIAHGWLAGAIFYAIYSRLGFNALIFIFAILTALAFWIVYRRSHSHPFISGFATLLGVWTVLPNIGVRPRVFTILLSSVYLAVLGRYVRRGGREIWWLVPLSLLWINLHGGFFIGLLLIGLTIMGMFLDAWAGGENLRALWPRLRTLGVVLILCSLAGLINPYGAQIYISPVRVLQSPVFQDLIVDFISPDFHLAKSRPLMLLILLTIAAFALSPKRVKPSELLLFLATLYATLKSQRNTAIFALVAAPLFADYFQHWFDSTSFGKSFGKTSSFASRRWSIIFGVLMLLPLIPFVAKLRSAVYAPPKQASLNVPVNAVEYLKQNQITGNTFTYPNVWGAYLIWEAPSNPVYIDGRDVYSEAFVKEFVDMTWGKADWRGPFDRHGVRVAVVEVGSLLARQLQESPAWEQIYQDEMSVVFKRRAESVGALLRMFKPANVMGLERATLWSECPEALFGAHALIFHEICEMHRGKPKNHLTRVLELAG